MLMARSIIAAMTDTSETQVLIAGGGPIGLTAAIELARRGVDVPHRRPACSNRLQYAKAVGVQPRTLEVFEGMGVLRQHPRRGDPDARPDRLRQR